MLHHGLETWTALLQKAQTLARGAWPSSLLDPYIVLQDVPALPARLPNDPFLTGRPRWRSTHEPHTQDEGEDDWDHNQTYGNAISLQPRQDAPVVCDISDEAASLLLGDMGEVTRSLAVLTPCWAYILSAKLLESQGLTMRYTGHRLTPIRYSAWKDHGANLPAIHLGHASSNLVRWLCCLLSSELGWTCAGEGYLPWSISLGKACIITVADDASPAALDCDAPPPGAAVATELLIEICRMFNMTAPASSFAAGPVSPYDMAFLAALMIPLARPYRLKPCFPPPHLQPGSKAFRHSDELRIRRYLVDAPYFMTLSLHFTLPLSSMWSIFWQPDVPCNLVSPWLTSAHRTLEPVIRSGDLELLVKALIARRPRCAIWWFALFMLGDRTILDRIPDYLTKMEEGTFPPPDPLAAPWTGTRVSFLDDDPEDIYGDNTDKVPRADWLRCRSEFKPQDSGCVSQAWRPSGNVEKAEIEPELWPWLEEGYRRQYLHFTWFVKQRDSTEKVDSHGFRRNTGRAVEHASDDLWLREPSKPYPGDCLRDLSELPSRVAVRKMMDSLVENALYERNWGNSLLPGDLANYRWLEDWEGIVSMELPLRQSVAPDNREDAAVEAWLSSLTSDG
jgi:hypothetical protein